MPDYQKMYYAICTAASRALDILPATTENIQARSELETALLEAEDIYIDTAGLIQFPTSETENDLREEEILAQLRACAPRDRETALHLLDVYLRSLDG